MDKVPLGSEEEILYLCDCFLNDLRQWFTIKPYRACPGCGIVLFMDFLGRDPIGAYVSDMIIAIFSKLSGCQDFSALNSQNWIGKFVLMA